MGNTDLMKLIFLILFLNQSIQIIESHILSAEGIIQTLNLRLIRKGINDIKPENFGNIAIKFYVFEKDEKDNLIEIYNGEYNSVMGVNVLPLCMDYALFHMSLMERVILNCPAKWGFKDIHVSSFKGVEKNKDYVIDMQLWNIGDKYTLVD